MLSCSCTRWDFQRAITIGKVHFVAVFSPPPIPNLLFYVISYLLSFFFFKCQLCKVYLAFENHSEILARASSVVNAGLVIRANLSVVLLLQVADWNTLAGGRGARLDATCCSPGGLTPVSPVLGLVAGERRRIYVMIWFTVNDISPRCDRWIVLGGCHELFFLPSGLWS